MLPSWSNLRVKSELLANDGVTVRHNAVLLSYWICGPTSVGSSRCFGNMWRMRHGCTWIPCRVALPSAFLPIAASCRPQIGCPVPNIEIKSLIWKWQSDTFCRIGISRTHTWNMYVWCTYVLSWSSWNFILMHPTFHPTSAVVYLHCKSMCSKFDVLSQFATICRRNQSEGLWQRTCSLESIEGIVND